MIEMIKNSNSFRGGFVCKDCRTKYYEPVIKRPGLWLARDKDEKLYIHNDKPIRNTDKGRFEGNFRHGDYLYIFDNQWKNVTWKNSPIKL